MSEPKTFPNFIGIGAQKAGTSWLHECLKKHSEIWLPPEKEIHYFDRYPSYPSTPTFLYPDNPIQRFFGKETWNKTYRDRCKQLFTTYRNHPKLFRWYLNYLLRTSDDNWYASLFKEGRDKIRGEFTPAYSMLIDEHVDHVRAIMPDCKIVFILRNPIERAWSQFRFMVRINRMNPESNFEEFKAWVQTPEQRDRSDYLRIIDRWQNAFSEKQVLVCFYDDIVSRPEHLLVEVLDFIGASSDATTIGAILERDRVNVSPEMEIPNQFQQYLREVYHQDLVDLAARLGGPTKSWLAESLVS